MLDVTESMQPYIDAVKQNIIQFVNDLGLEQSRLPAGAGDFRGLRRLGISRIAIAPIADTMTSDVQKFIGWVGSLHAGGGGDIPEDQLDALDYAAKFPFRPTPREL